MISYQCQLVFIALLLIRATASIDRSYQGTRVILQSDVDTILIHTKLGPISTHLKDTEIELTSIRNGIQLHAENAITSDANNSQFFKVLIGIVKSNLDKIVELKVRLHEVVAQNSQSHDKRALEFLGDFLSGLTGVPSASEHRKTLEKVKLMELDSRSIMALMKENTAKNHDLIQTIEVHENMLVQLHNNSAINSKHILSIRDQLIQGLTALSMSNKVMESLIYTSQTIAKAREIMARSDAGMLSRNSIQFEQLRDLIDKIYLKRKTREDAPIFSGKHCEQYFKLPLAHSWASEETYELVTLLQVPIAALNDHKFIELLDNTNRFSTDLGMAVVDYGSNTYRFLSDSDFHKCTEIGRKLVCQKREINIKPRSECGIKINNCNNWAEIIVHDITNTRILLSQPNNSSAFISCEKQKTREIQLPTSAILDIPVFCRLRTDNFSIGMIEFNHLADYESAFSNDYGPDLDIEMQVFETTPAKKLALNISLTRSDINKLKDENVEFSKKLDEQEIRHAELWAKTEKPEKTVTEQIITYTLIAAAILISFTAMSVVCKMQVRIWRRGHGDKRADEAHTKCRDIESRLMDLETNIQLANIRKGQETKATEPPPKYGE